MTPFCLKKKTLSIYCWVKSNLTKTYFMNANIMKKQSFNFFSIKYDLKGHIWPFYV